MSTIPVFVTHGDGEPVILRIPEDNYYVGDLVKAVIDELRLGVTADKVILRHTPGGDGGAGAKLDPTASLAAARVLKESQLVVEVKSAPAVGACSARGDPLLFGIALQCSALVPGVPALRHVVAVF